MTVFAGRAVDVFRLASIPPASEVEWIAAAANTVHGVGGKLLLALVALHAGAAVKHHFLDRDATLVRMWSGRLDRETAGCVQQQRG